MSCRQTSRSLAVEERNFSKTSRASAESSTCLVVVHNSCVDGGGTTGDDFSPGKKKKRCSLFAKKNSS